MLAKTLTLATVCTALAMAPAIADSQQKPGTPVTPAKSAKSTGPTGKTGSSDPKAAGTPVAPSKGTGAVTR